ncbi:rhomboid family intramembrane serine protease [Bacillus tianshenii]|uniref:rhomboid family protein n=1 Tax=Sutcliffiella tianshenii TaxID=1463404 RepID=UPI001CD3BDF8|nr:rhomboid family intramembrane serine protease [Bacillus tianshenii]MCA1318975.1 rhomboid family intramembrane serine protease [Bacillus tianshenii]
MKQDFVFWHMLNSLVVTHEYRIIHISPDHKEVWLEGLGNKQAPIIRVYRYDLDWSTWLQRDMEKTAFQVANFRKQLRKSKLSAVNIYVSTYPPVDDWEFRLQEPLEKNKATVNSVVVHEGNLEHSCNRISNLIGKEVKVEVENEDEEALHHLKQIVLDASARAIKKEKELFQFGKPLFTYLFIAVQVIAFFILEMNGGSQNTETLIQYGAKFNPLILEGEWWRFFTPIFLHIGVLHLMLNTLALFYLGTAVERIYGNIRFLFVYLFAGFAGSLASFVFTPSISAGASGAIFGCFGALLFVGIAYPKVFLRTMGMNILVLIGVNLTIGFAIPGIDNAGHIGGLIGGFLAAAIVHLPKHIKPLPRILGLLLAGALTFYMLDYGYNNENPYTQISQAESLLQKGEYDQAYDMLIPLEEQKNEYPEVLFYLSFIDIKKGRINDAESRLVDVTALQPDFHEAHYNLALVYLEMKKTEKALVSIERAIEIEPDGANYENIRSEIIQSLDSE